MHFAFSTCAIVSQVQRLGYYPNMNQICKS